MKAFSKNEINLYRVYLRQRKPRCGYFPVGKVLALFAALLAAAGIAGGAMLINRRAQLENRLGALNSELHSEEITEGQSRYADAAAENERLMKYSSALSQQISPLYDGSGFGAYRAELFSDISAVCGSEVYLTQITSQDFTLSLEFEARRAEEVSEFVSRLRESSIFSDIVYSGYHEAGGSYRFTLVCTLEADGGAADE